MTPPRRPPLLVRFWRKLFPEKPKPVPLTPLYGKKRPVRGLDIEPLEGRIAPASLIDPSTVSFSDLDGDTVTVRFSKPLFTLVGADLTTALEAVFEFGDSTGAHLDFGTANTPAQQLQQIDLTKVPKIGLVNPAAGVSITITALPSSLGGNAMTNVGAIKADALALGKVAIAGDLGQIDCGVAASAVGLRSLAVGSLGHIVGTQMGTSDFESKITGALGSLAVAGDVNGYLHVVSGTGGANKAFGKIGSIKIGGTLGAGGATRDSAGLIQADTDVGAVQIVGDVAGGGGKNSGAIMAAGRIVSVTLGNLLGNGGEGSGAISAAGTVGVVKVSGDVQGGDGPGSGVIKARALGSVTVGDDLVAGEGAGSGRISSSGAMGVVKIFGEVNGQVADAGAGSGAIAAGGRIVSVHVDGALLGGGAASTGSIQALDDLGAVKIGGNLEGRGGRDSGSVSSGGRLGSVIIGGGISGGDGPNSGAIFGSFGSVAGIGSVRVTGSVTGGAGDGSGAIVSGGGIAFVQTGTSGGGASIRGGAGDFSGVIFASGAIRSVKLTGDLEGGTGPSSGTITARGILGSAAIAGTIIGGEGASSGSVFTQDATEIAGGIGRLSAEGLSGGAGPGSGVISSAGPIGSVVLGSFFDGAGAGSGQLISGAGALAPGHVGSITVGLFGQQAAALTTAGGTFEIHGSLRHFAANEMAGAKMHIDGSLGTVRVAGSVIGTTVTVAGQGGVASLGRFAVAGAVESSEFLVGYSAARTAVNPEAFIGSVTVGGNWMASDLVAGVRDVAADGFGNGDDAALPLHTTDPRLARIANVIVGGTVSGTAVDGDRFGFVAQQIGSFRHGLTRLALDGRTSGESFAVAGDVSVREVAA